MRTFIATVMNAIFHPFAGNAPTAPADSPAAWTLLAATRQKFVGAAANLAAPNVVAPTPVLVLNGYNVVPASTLNVTTFYGLYTNPPAVGGTVQGTQLFNLVDPNTNETVGTFKALVSQNNSDLFGAHSTELLVLSTEGTDPADVGTGAGQIPPVGSIINSYMHLGFGNLYSSMPTSTGEDVISYRLITPFTPKGIPVRTKYDAAKGVADHTFDNRPIVGDGYTIKPIDPNGENLTGITGNPPLFTAIQGEQVFGVYDNDTDALLGTFHGYFTTTSDFFNAYTEAIYVTDVISRTPGTAVTDIPPVGSVFNVVYLHDDNRYVLYNSRPSTTPGGPDVVTTDLFLPKNEGKPPIKLTSRFDASAPFQIDSRSIPRGYTLEPVGDFQLAGVNGLPPREVQLQGYQQYIVKDSLGNPIGTIDADVYRQTDAWDNHSEAILVTNIVDGAGQVPPVGSVFNFLDEKHSGYGVAYSAIPQDSGPNQLTYFFMTPLGGIPLYTNYDAAAGLTDYDYFNPFASMMAMMDASLGAGLAGPSQTGCDTEELCV